MQSPPVIQNLSIQGTSVELYGKVEIKFDLTARYSNPYDYEEIEIKASFRSPEEKTIEVDGFFMEEFQLQTNGSLISGEERFKVRFSPHQIGIWTFQIRVSDKNGTAKSLVQSFVCVEISHPHNHGFVRTNASNYLLHDDGEQYIPIGGNMSWQNNNPFVDYQRWLKEYIATGANFLRLWHTHWGLGIEWKNGWRGFRGLKHYHQINSRYQDWLFDFCADNGIYIMLCLQHHGQVSTQVNPIWTDNPYASVNGGSCEHSWDFFRNEEAILTSKNRLRYIIARWGYARSIMAWELWNEVEWTDNYAQHQAAIKEWCKEIATFIKEQDPYGHLLTTSYAKSANDPDVWSNPHIDLTQTHVYINSPNIERNLSSAVRAYLNDFGKPNLIGEFGLGHDPTKLGMLDPNGIHLHNGMWAGVFGGGLGTAMSWWWDQYIHPQGLYYHFAPLAKVVNKIPFLDKKLRPRKGVIRGAPGTLHMSPTLDWGEIGIGNITIYQDGTLDPKRPSLSRYLYGARWNTQYRNPPTFTVAYSEDGTFAVQTADQSAQSPRIAIWLDGVKLFDQYAKPNTLYKVDISAGLHDIKVENPGTDWISIEAYSVSSLGSLIDAYVLSSEDETAAAGWVLNHQYNHQIVPVQGEPESVSGAELWIEGFAAGTYDVKWYNCQTGEIFRNETVRTVHNTLRFFVPDLLWDAAFVVNEQFVHLTNDPV
ncbi:MAG: DUF5060 domain-containing protein [Bacteroidota bacterium]